MLAFTEFGSILAALDFLPLTVRLLISRADEQALDQHVRLWGVMKAHGALLRGMLAIPAAPASPRCSYPFDFGSVFIAAKYRMPASLINSRKRRPPSSILCLRQDRPETRLATL